MHYSDREAFRDYLHDQARRELVARLWVQGRSARMLILHVNDHDSVSTVVSYICEYDTMVEPSLRGEQVVMSFVDHGTADDFTGMLWPIPLTFGCAELAFRGLVKVHFGQLTS